MQIVFNTRRSVQQSLDHGKGDRVYGIARNRQIVEVHRRHKRKPKQHKKLVFSSAPPRSASPTGRSLKRSGGRGGQEFSAIYNPPPRPSELVSEGDRGRLQNFNGLFGKRLGCLFCHYLCLKRL